MSDLILYIVKQLVTNPDAVRVDEQNNGGEVNLLLTVAPEDMGLIIGKSGQTIKALRKILIIKAMADNVRVNLQLAEPAGQPASPAKRGEQVSESSESASAEATVDTSAESADQLTGEVKKTKTPRSKKSEVTETPTEADEVAKQD